MKFQQLKVLIAISNNQSLAKAADELNVSLSAITKSITNLEEELGVSLLDRSGYRVVLNKYGVRLAEHARIIRANMDEAQRDIQLLKQQNREVVRINAAPALYPKLLPEAIHQFKALMPKVSITFEGHLVGHAQEKLSDLANGEYDILINIIPEGIDLSNFSYRVLAEMEVQVVTNHNHPVASLQNPTLEQLRDYTWIIATGNKGNPINTMRKMFTDADTRMPDDVIMLPTREMAFSLLKKGQYILFSTYHPNLYEHESDEFHSVVSAQIHAGWPLFMVLRKNSLPTIATQAFADLLLELAAKTELTDH